MSSFKTQLKDAFTGAVSYFQDGGDPNDAAELDASIARHFKNENKNRMEVQQ